MNETLINNWNSKVQPNDTVFHLGDFSFMTEAETEKVLRRLNGNKHLIWGNHDKVIKNSKTLQGYFNWCRDYHELYIVDVKLPVVLCHYAMLVWNKSHRGSYMLHGHSHGSLRYPFPARIMDVGVDPQGYFPISEHDVIRKLSKVEMTSVDHHGE
jgi:calcineurin-like phosphoesterase family protein